MNKPITPIYKCRCCGVIFRGSTAYSYRDPKTFVAIKGNEIVEWHDCDIAHNPTGGIAKDVRKVLGVADMIAVEKE